MTLRREQSRRRLALWVGAVMASSALATAVAGEKMLESAPTKARPKLSSPTPSIDPILDRLLNPNTVGSESGGMQSMPIVPTVRPGLDPVTQKRLGQQLDKRRNWLLENAAQINGLGQIRDLEIDDTPRFSQPGTGLTTRSAGERLLRATDTSSHTDSQRGNQPQNRTDSSSSQNRDEAEAETASVNDASRAVPFRSRSGDDGGTLNAKASDVSRSGKVIFSESGPFSSPGRSLLEDTRRTANEERNAVFDRLLRGGSAPAGPSTAANGLNSLGLSTSTPSRSQQLQSLLAGPETPTTSANVFGSPFGTASAAKPPGILTDHAPAANLGPIGPAIAPRPAAVRMEPRPALLQIPTRGF
jgi:hypothetical protein